MTSAERKKAVAELQKIAARMSSDLADLEYTEEWQLSEVTAVSGACSHIREEMYRLWHASFPPSLGLGPHAGARRAMRYVAVLWWVPVLLGAFAWQRWQLHRQRQANAAELARLRALHADCNASTPVGGSPYFGARAPERKTEGGRDG